MHIQKILLNAKNWLPKYSTKGCDKFDSTFWVGFLWVNELSWVLKFPWPGPTVQLGWLEIDPKVGFLGNSLATSLFWGKIVENKPLLRLELAHNKRISMSKKEILPHTTTKKEKWKKWKRKRTTHAYTKDLVECKKSAT